jgi:signal recognition particle-docking protein FtsY
MFDGLRDRFTKFQGELTGEDDDGPGALERAGALARGQVIIEAADLEEPLWDLQMALVQSDVEMRVAEALTAAIEDRLVGERRAQVSTTTGLVEEALGEALLEVISVGQFAFFDAVEAADGPVTILVTGVNGVGKTTTLAKLAYTLEQRGLSVVLANGDTYRAGANEQLQGHADALDVRLISHDEGGDPTAVLYDAREFARANGVDVILADTAGRLHTSTDLMAQLEKIDRVIDPEFTLFVDEAIAGQDAVRRAEEFDAAAPFDGVILTKADADPDGGAAISIAYVTGAPVLFLGVGQGYEDLDRFAPEQVVEQILTA